ncbi:MAG: esterase/lipase family protein [Syntrophales bacterium]
MNTSDLNEITMPNISKNKLEGIKHLLHPIIYVRGYAMTENERDETTADPFCGFNLGSTVYRADINRENKARKFVFESPVVRLMSDFGYTDVYENGLDIMDEGWTDKIPYRSIIVYRYYEQGSSLLGNGKTSPIETYARDLGKLISKVRGLVVDQEDQGVIDFKCHLVAHSMGGLVCRAFLQNPTLDPDYLRNCVDKVYTYATPHNGIEMGGINIPSWLSKDDMNNFNRTEMAKLLALGNDPEYLAQEDGKRRVDFLRNFNPDHFFCMIGTNRDDYNVAAGLSRTFAGNGSDGLVKIDNAGLVGKDSQGTTIPCPRAYAYRSHSGFFGIVNSEEAFQNLTRFLFGDLRVDILFDVVNVTLPTSLQNKGNDVQAAYHFEIKAGPRGKPWNLTRRIAEEDSVAVRTHEELNDASKKSIYLSTVFLSKWAKVDDSDNKLSYAVHFQVGVQEYLEKGILFKSHYEGAKLFSDTLIVSVAPDEPGEWHWAQDSANDPQALTLDNQKELAAGRPVSLSVSIPTVPEKAPGITGNLRFVLTPWNR